MMHYSSVKTVLLLLVLTCMAYAKPGDSKNSKPKQQEQLQSSNGTISGGSGKSHCTAGWVHWVINDNKSACCPASQKSGNGKRTPDESLEERAAFITTKPKKKYGKMAKGKHHLRRGDKNETSHLDSAPQWKDCYIITTQPPASESDDTVEHDDDYDEDDASITGFETATATAQKAPLKTATGGGKSTNTGQPLDYDSDATIEANGGVSITSTMTLVRLILPIGVVVAFGLL